jgi:hypothetical protein
MTDKQKTTKEERRAPFEGIPFAAMMQKMMGRQWPGWNCARPNVMSQMMAMCWGVQDETKEEAATEASQKA